MSVIDEAHVSDAQRNALLERFQIIATEYRQAKDNPDVNQLPVSHSLEVLNLADVGFGIAYHLVPLLAQEVTRLQLASTERDAHKLAQKLTRWQRWVLRVAANGAQITHYEGIAGSGGTFTVGNTFYMGGDPNANDKSEAVASLVGVGVLAALPMPDMMHDHATYYRLTDYGAQVAEQLVAIEALATQGEDAHAD